MTIGISDRPLSATSSDSIVKQQVGKGGAVVNVMSNFDTHTGSHVQ